MPNPEFRNEREERDVPYQSLLKVYLADRDFGRFRELRVRNPLVE